MYYDQLINYDQFINLGNNIQKEEFVNLSKFGKKVVDIGKKAAPKVTNVVKKSAPKVTNVAKKGAGVIGAGAAYTVKNPKTVAAGTAALGTVAYVAADQGLLGDDAQQYADDLGDDAQQYADDLGDATEDAAGKVGGSLKKGMGKVTDAAENMLLKKVNEVSNKWFNCDIDTLFIAICILVFFFGLVLKSPVPVVLSFIGGISVAINKYI
jgi:hypothetical protein